MKLYRFVVVVSFILQLGCRSEVNSFNLYPCYCEDNSDVSTIISDSELRREFSEKAKILIDDKKITDMTSLLSQLDKKECFLTLPSESKKEIASEVLYEGYLDTVLMVGKPYQCKNKNCKKIHTSIASGFVLTASGAFVTNYHVVNANKEDDFKTIVVMNGRGKMWPVKEVLAADEDNDFCILQLDGEGFKPLPIRGNVKVGEKIRTITHPTGRFFSMSEGIVTRKYYREGKSSSKNRGVWINIDADYCKGSSGGPIIDRFGNVVGIVSSTNSIYYKRDDKRKLDLDLQMVFKNVPSAENFKKVIKTPKK